MCRIKLFEFFDSKNNRVPLFKIQYWPVAWVFIACLKRLIERNRFKKLRKKYKQENIFQTTEKNLKVAQEFSGTPVTRHIV